MTSPEQVRAIPDPAERARAARAAQGALEAQRDEYAAIVREAVRELRAAGLSLAKVAAAVGVSSGRVQQLEKP